MPRPICSLSPRRAASRRTQKTRWEAQVPHREAQVPHREAQVPHREAQVPHREAQVPHRAGRRKSPTGRRKSSTRPCRARHRRERVARRRHVFRHQGFWDRRGRRYGRRSSDVRSREFWDAEDLDEPRREGVDDLILKIEQLTDLAIDLDGLGDGVGFNVHNPCCDPELVSEPLIAASHEPRHAGVARRRSNGLLIQPSSLPAKHAPATGDRETGDPFELSRHRFGDAGAEPIVVQLTGDIDERNHHDGLHGLPEEGPCQPGQEEQTG